MATTETVMDREAIAGVVQLYIDGASKGDAGELKEAFHEQAWMFGSIGDERFDMPITQMIEILTSQPLDSDGGYRAEVTSVEQVGDAAVATIELEGCWGGVSFTDYLSLTRIGGAWKIVNKTFAHTGGEMPAA